MPPRQRWEFQWWLFPWLLCQWLLCHVFQLWFRGPELLAVGLARLAETVSPGVDIAQAPVVAAANVTVAAVRATAWMWGRRRPALMVV